ncbi:SRPBCC family protein [Natronosporangium hydrolyticum]|uniref:SRPBCC family protein n=1 Tax=Natronosporangium hydrolyticum TaxID=2811111 RepID=A0A895YRB5_9ACTN|nr:SRPBCC family protein [Natronosporangium hydrolyticum]QSB16558.1 SRPBCC family protein [Natronosporangium hydrolyticum]
MIDIREQLNAVERRIGDRSIEAGAAKTVTISETYRASIDDVWDACTNPERLPRWFLPVSGELRPGGSYQFEGNAGGTIETCDPPHSVTATWEYGGAVSWVELRLHPESDERTRLELTHIMLPDEHWVEFGPGATGIGWELALIGLARHLDSGAGVDPAAAATWPTSQEGLEFVTISSQRWLDAHLAAGADEAAARASAERCTAFYTGAAPA